MMTKKDYELIADVLRTIPTGHVTMAAHNAAKASIAKDFADALGSAYPRFDRERFLRACQPESARGGR